MGMLKGAGEDDSIRPWEQHRAADQLLRICLGRQDRPPNSPVDLKSEQPYRKRYDA